MSGANENPLAPELVALAEDVARAAGELLASFTGRVTVADTKSSPTDVVTEMDRRAEALIRERILAARPGDTILGEEGGEQAGAVGDGDGDGGADGDGAAGAAVRWVVDPLDGTVNYLYGLHDWAVSIAAEVGGVIVAGAVCVPRRDEMFTASAGGGAWVSACACAGAGAGAGGRAGGARVALRSGPGVPLDRALVATGFGYRAERRKAQGEVVAALLPRVRDIRRGGSASVDLCAVAAGRVDAYYERGLNYWDYAAGALIAAEAGATVGGLRGAPPGTSMTVAAGPDLFGPLASALAALAALDAERDG